MKGKLISPSSSRKKLIRDHLWEGRSFENPFKSKSKADLAWMYVYSGQTSYKCNVCARSRPRTLSNIAMVNYVRFATLRLIIGDYQRTFSNFLINLWKRLLFENSLQERSTPTDEDLYLHSLFCQGTNNFLIQSLMPRRDLSDTNR